MAEGGGDKKKEDVDPRLEFISVYVMKTYRFKIDKWQKLMTSDDKVTNHLEFPLDTLNKKSFEPFFPDNNLRLVEQSEGRKNLFWNWSVRKSDGVQSISKRDKIEDCLLCQEVTNGVDR